MASLSRLVGSCNKIFINIIYCVCNFFTAAQSIARRTTRTRNMEAPNNAAVTRMRKWGRLSLKIAGRVVSLVNRYRTRRIGGGGGGVWCHRITPRIILLNAIPWRHDMMLTCTPSTSFAVVIDADQSIGCSGSDEFAT